VQETFLTVWTKWQTFQGKSKFSSWIYRIAANHAYMKLRKRRKHQGNVSLDVDLTGSDTWIGRNISVAWANDAASPSHEVELEEKRALLERAIQELKPGYRTAYILRDIEGMCLEEIAEIMNLSEPAVKSRVHRARLKLRKILAPLLYGTTVKHLGDING
jgi:RNA polymerase sigma-70 factor (ECF subfamily)